LIGKRPLLRRALPGHLSGHVSVSAVTAVSGGRAELESSLFVALFLRGTTRAL